MSKALLAKISKAEASIIASTHGSAVGAITKKKSELNCDAATARRYLMVRIVSDVVGHSARYDLPLTADADDVQSQQILE